MIPFLLLLQAQAAMTLTPSKENLQVALQGKSISFEVKTAFSVPIAPAVSWVAKGGDKEIAKGEFNTTKEDVIIDKVVLEGFVFQDIGFQSFTVEFTEGNSTEPTKVDMSVRCIPGWVTLIPVIITLLLAFITHQVLIALGLGVWISISIVEGGNVFNALLRTVDTYLVKALYSEDRIKIVLFTWFLSMMVSLIVKSGGAKGLAVLFKGLVTNSYTGQWATLLLGCVIFFDDYASALIVGHNMRLITDTVLMSHEKLAFIVHATAAGPASIAPISSWIGFELGLVKDSLPADYSLDSFEIFIKSIPSRFYPFFVLLIIAYSAGMKRDFGPMLMSERRAKRTGLLVPADDSCAQEVNGDEESPLLDQKEEKEGKWFNAIIPLLFMIIGVVVGLFMSGYYSQLASEEPDFSVAGLAGSGNSYNALIWSSFGSVVICILLYTVQGCMSLRQCMDTVVEGVKDITEALLVLTLAWSISSAFKAIQVPEFIVGGLGDNLNATLLPPLVFGVSCLISFATGTSWGTMAIVFPLAMPLALSIGKEYD
jgi:Na+/H+ antiporter NhaC